MTNLKENIWCEGFKNDFEIQQYWYSHRHEIESVIYQGKASEIPEEIAREVCELQQVFNTEEYIKQDIDRYRNYRVIESVWFDCTAKQSIKSAVTKPDGTIYPYIIIFKK